MSAETVESVDQPGVRVVPKPSDFGALVAVVTRALADTGQGFPQIAATSRSTIDLVVPLSV